MNGQSSIKTKPHHFKNIGLIGRPGRHAVNETVLHIYQYLIDNHYHVIFDEHSAHMVGLNHVQTVARQLLGEACDLVIVVGGDGSILHAAHVLAQYKVPVLGINRGRLGFLADVSPEDALVKIEQVLNGQYQLDHRTLMHMEIRSHGHVTHEAMALNDVVLHAGKSVHMIDFELYIDGHYVYRQHSDGLIVSTPTGSTAYALSGGGPILHPSVHALEIVPMHPHTLSSRPIVVGGESEINIVIRENRVHPMVSTDGQPSISLAEGDWIHIRKHPHKLTLIHPPGYDFYAACRTKLGWSHYLEKSDEYERDTE